MKPCTLFIAAIGLFAASIAAAAAPTGPEPLRSASTSVGTISDASSPSMLWLGHRRLSFGLGQRRGPALNHAEPTLGIGVALTPAATITFERDARPLRTHEAWVSDDANRVALSFRTTSRSREVKSLMTVQLSGQSVLLLRPRGSGLRAVYTASF